MNLMIKDFPDDLRWKIRMKAMRAGLTLREAVISLLERWVEGDQEHAKRKPEDSSKREEWPF